MSFANVWGRDFGMMTFTPDLPYRIRGVLSNNLYVLEPEVKFGEVSLRHEIGRTVYCITVCVLAHHGRILLKKNKCLCILYPSIRLYYKR